VTDLRDRSARLAVELLRHGARFVVVGGAARRILTREGSPRDLDVVVDEPDLPCLVAALGGLGVCSSASVLGRAGQSHVDTSWGPLDVFVDRPPSSRGVPFVRASVAVVLPVAAV
jgi:hypothetical protein